MQALHSTLGGSCFKLTSSDGREFWHNLLQRDPTSILDFFSPPRNILEVQEKERSMKEHE